VQRTLILGLGLSDSCGVVSKTAGLRNEHGERQNLETQPPEGGYAQMSTNPVHRPILRRSELVLKSFQRFAGDAQGGVAVHAHADVGAPLHLVCKRHCPHPADRADRNDVTWF
jgi:hypothetical protein